MLCEAHLALCQCPALIALRFDIMKCKMVCETPLGLLQCPDVSMSTLSTFLGIDSEPWDVSHTTKAHIVSMSTLSTLLGVDSELEMLHIPLRFTYCQCQCCQRSWALTHTTTTHIVTMSMLSTLLGVDSEPGMLHIPLQPI